jgi:hypothetical protein
MLCLTHNFVSQFILNCFNKAVEIKHVIFLILEPTRNLSLKFALNFEYIFLNFTITFHETTSNTSSVILFFISILSSYKLCDSPIKGEEDDIYIHKLVRK